MKITLILLTLTFIASSYVQKGNLIKPAINSTTQPGEFNLEDTTNFTLVKDYIKQNGKKRTVNASSSLDKEMMVNYHYLFIDSMEITIDHSDRIYMSLNEIHYGNILKENGKVRPEIIYGVTDKNPELTKAKEIKVLEIYRELIVLALRK